jgi:hypothetical protein
MLLNYFREGIITYIAFYLNSKTVQYLQGSWYMHR